jgi:Adenine/guanine phosphoribosyltransferases and related PRPP-binding proteins
METYKTDIKGYPVELPILPIGNGIKICFFNLHGAQKLTEHCAVEIAKLVRGAEVVMTAESKGLQLAHCVARILGHEYYAVARKSQKLYMQDGISVTVKSITTAACQTLYLSRHDTELIKGKKTAIIDDVISTGGSLQGLEALTTEAGGIIFEKAFVLAEGAAKDRKDVKFLQTIPVLSEK